MSHFRRIWLLGGTVVVAAACAGLGFWQLDRLQTRRAENQRSLSQRDLPVLDLAVTSPPAGLTYRRSQAAGTYDFDNEFLLRGRVHLGAPGVQVITPLRIPGRDTAVLVHRGFVPTPDAGPPPPGVQYREPATATVSGIARPMPDAGDGAPIEMPHGESWRRLDLTAMRGRLPYPVAAYYLIVAADTARSVDHTAKGSVLPLRVEPPVLDDGPHLSYAIQWFLIGATAIGFGLAFARRGRPGAHRGGGGIAPPPGAPPKG
jgi:surfeit locus 1 family protein